MASVHMIKSACGGTEEFMSGTVLFNTAGDSIIFEFNEEATIDDVLLNVTSATSGDEFNIEIWYPSSDQTAPVGDLSLSGTDGHFFLNSSEGVGKIWYRIPARGHLRVTNTTLDSTAQVNLVALGRGGA